MGGAIVRNTIAKVSEETLKIQAYIETLPAGTEISYDELGRRAKVRMDNRGKQFLRRALHRAKIESSTIKGYGIKLADAKNAMGLITHKLQRIDRSVRRGERTHKNIQEQFFMELSAEKQREILYLGAVFGAIRVAAENGKIIYSQKPKEVKQNINIPIPNMK